MARSNKQTDLSQGSFPDGAPLQSVGTYGRHIPRALSETRSAGSRQGSRRLPKKAGRAHTASRPRRVGAPRPVVPALPSMPATLHQARKDFTHLGLHSHVSLLGTIDRVVAFCRYGIRPEGNPRRLALVQIDLVQAVGHELLKMAAKRPLPTSRAPSAATRKAGLTEE